MSGKWIHEKLSVNTVLIPGGRVVVNIDCRPDEVMDKDHREEVEGVTDRITKDHNALAGIPDPAEFVTAAKELLQAIPDDVAINPDFDVCSDSFLNALSRLRAAMGGEK